MDRSRGKGIEGELGRRRGEEDEEGESGEAGCLTSTIVVGKVVSSLSTPHPLPRVLGLVDGSPSRLV